MGKRAISRVVMIISLALLLGGCRWGEGFTVVLPDREIKVTIPETGAKLADVDLNLFENDRIIGSGEWVTVDRDVQDFDQISIMGLGDVSIIQGDVESLTVTIEENLLLYLVAEVKINTLTLGWDPEIAEDKDLRPTHPVQFEIVVKDLTAISIYGSADVASEKLVSDRMRFEIFGAGDISVDRVETDLMLIDIYGVGQVDIDALLADELEVGIFGMGNVIVAGEVVDQEIRIPGKGDYRADDLESEHASVFIMGSGDATLWVTERIEGKIYGSGHMKYYGDPELFFQGSGSRDLISLGER